MIDVEEYFSTAARKDTSSYSGQLTPEFQEALRSYHSRVDLADCEFYHTTKLPSGYLVEGEWDLRGREAAYLGGFNFNNKRVLELGPASGHLTFFLESAGASVVAFDMPFDSSPAIVPTPGIDLALAIESGKRQMRRLRNSWWYNHFQFRSISKVVYGDILNLPTDLGWFDAAIFAAILLHLPDPFGALQQAASKVKEAVVVVEPFVESAHQHPILYFNPSTKMPGRIVHWWSLSPAAVERMLMALGFPAVSMSKHYQRHRTGDSGLIEEVEWFTIVGRRSLDVVRTPDHRGETYYIDAREGGPAPQLSGAAVEVEVTVNPLPPPSLRYLVSGTEDQGVFSELGKRAFEAMIADLRANNANIRELGSILDFGCGVGRVIRYWVKWPELRVHGVDINAELIEWCNKNLPLAICTTSQLSGVLDFGNETFGFVYGLSVFTHLPAPLQLHWFRELVRVLKPGGFIYVTVHGLKCIECLDQEKRESFLDGNLVVTGSEAPGTNECAAFHPPPFVQLSFAKPFGLNLVKFTAGGATGNPPQDSYLLQKPGTLERRRAICGDMIQNGASFQDLDSTKPAGSVKIPV